jgi:hypothetical protein
MTDAIQDDARAVDFDGPMVHLLAVCAVRERGAVHKLVAPGEVWYERVDETWDAWINPHPVSAKIPRPDAGPLFMSGEVPPFHAWINYNGWLWALVTPYGGTVMAGEGANRETFAAACEAAATPIRNASVKDPL